MKKENKVNKNTDLTKSVMDKVVKIEKRRSWAWISRFVILNLILFLGGLGFLIIAGKQIFDMDTLSILSLLGEDREIISEFWQDSVSTFWEELPKAYIGLGIGLLIIVVILFWIKRKRIKLMIKKIKNIAMYAKKE
ncbi:MAG TPA: hypothetical protein VF185_01705 [Patescibacteria group bacterium]